MIVPLSRAFASTLATYTSDVRSHKFYVRIGSMAAAAKLMHKSVDEGVRKTVLDGFFKDLESSKAGQN